MGPIPTNIAICRDRVPMKSQKLLFCGNKRICVPHAPRFGTCPDWVIFECFQTENSITRLSLIRFESPGETFYITMWCRRQLDGSHTPEHCYLSRFEHDENGSSTGFRGVYRKYIKGGFGKVLGRVWMGVGDVGGSCGSIFKLSRGSRLPYRNKNPKIVQ